MGTNNRDAHENLPGWNRDFCSHASKGQSGGVQMPLVSVASLTHKSLLTVLCAWSAQPLLREFQHVFGDNISAFMDDSDTGAEFLAIPTNQCAREDLVTVGEKVEEEKDRLLNVFMSFARVFCQKIRDAGYWAGTYIRSEKLRVDS